MSAANLRSHGWLHSEIGSFLDFCFRIGFLLQRRHSRPNAAAGIDQFDLTADAARASLSCSRQRVELALMWPAPIEKSVRSSIFLFRIGFVLQMHGLRRNGVAGPSSRFQRS